ncbi:conserved hypothetical protein [uncultured Pleomorphomonas sp.]|uniref:Uncharacterized protein n=1 Tax=uncultured Pleomorphomonas sp. TaxID=442121 RepID=A0A212L1U9_9HYPH|nr:major capsid protein [uncultured Pleomorphomonas sp.]SCM71510.1 conserved hypothetical protein [uncultured Pleomorphomonas sp.]
MTPTPSDVHVNVPLSNISVAYFQDASAFIADQVFPNIPVDKQSNTYYVYDRGDFNRDEMKERAPSTESEGGGYKLSPDGLYFCRKYSVHKDIPDEVRGNADAAINLDTEASRYLSLKALIRREKLFTGTYFKAGVWAQDLTGVASGASGSQRLRWDDSASDPVVQIKAEKREQQRRTGFKPNTLVIGPQVWDALTEHPDIIDRIKYGQTPGSPAIVSRQTIAALFEIERILVAEAVENTAKEGLAEVSAFIAGKHALLCHVTPAPGLLTPTAGYTFSWTGMYGSSNLGTRVKSFRMDNIESDRIEIDMCMDMRVVGADMGTFWAGIVS